MKQESNKRLYFTNDFSPENVAELQGKGYTLRKASAYHEADTLEACAEVAGDVPQAYLDLIARTKANIITANVQVSITPELQATIDEAKAECEKVVAENAELKTKFQGAEVERDALSTKVKELDLQSVELAEQLNKEREAVKKLTSDNEALNAQLKNPEAKAKKLTAAEAKTAKAAEEAAKVDEPKE